MYYARLGFLLLSVAFINNAMKKEDEKKLDILAQIPTKKTFWDCVRNVNHITDDSFVAGGYLGKCDIVDWRAGTSKALNNFLTCLSVNTNNKRIILGQANVLTIYDENGKQEWSLKKEGYIHKCVFDPTNDFLFICSTPAIVADNFTVTSQNYYDNGPYERVLNHRISSIIDFNPCKEEMAVWDDPYMLLYTLSGMPSTPKRIKLPCECNFGRYSPDSTCIIAGYEHRIFKIDLAKEEVSTLLNWDNSAEFQKILFYSPNVLVTIARIFAENIHKVQYWDIKTKKLIYEMPSFESDCALSISPHKKNMVIAVEDKYLVVSIPFEVMYESDIKSKFHFLLFTLHHLQTQQEISQDIVGYCKNILLELFER